VAAGRILLAVVFASAGLAKLFDARGSRQAMIEFGVPGALAGVSGRFLPLAELAVAVALMPVASARLGAAGALVLLAAFVAVIAVNLARGRHPDCHCFGQLHSGPAGWTTLMRNLALAGVAALVVWAGPGTSAIAWASGRSGGAIAGVIVAGVVLVALALEAWLLFNVVGQNGRLLVRVETLEGRGRAQPTVPTGVPAVAAPGLPVGTAAPEFTLPGIYGETLTLGALRAAGTPVMLLFTDPGCAPCRTLMPEVANWQREHAGRLAVAVVSSGSPEAVRVEAAEFGLRQVLVQPGNEVASAYRFIGTPGAVVVSADGRVATPVVGGVGGIRALLTQALGEPHSAAESNGGAPNTSHTHPPAPFLHIGQPAPGFSLPDLRGRTVQLTQFRGKELLLVFWDPGCGFCQQMLPELKAWEAAPPPGAPKLVVVSTGDPEVNKALELRGPVLIDGNFQVGPSYGVTGTPMGVRIDEHGNVASDLGVGASGIWGLVSTDPAPST
jgi:peroxiredoxin/uncharacterized membrane protein YphA (DoxX/SURF4 family)